MAFDTEVRRLHKDYADLPADYIRRLLRLYGTKARVILGDAKSLADLGTHFGRDLYAAEVDYLCTVEWARTAQDILWRRTKLGLRVTPAEVQSLEAYLAA